MAESITTKGNEFLNSIENLSAKIETLTEAQTRSMEKTDRLTEAVTQLLVQSGHFEKLRAEDNHRMDKIETSVQSLRSEVFTECKNIHEKLGETNSKLDQAKPVLGILMALFTAAILGAFLK